MPMDGAEAYYDFMRGDLGDFPEDKLYHAPEISDALELARLEPVNLSLESKDSTRESTRRSDPLWDEMSACCLAAHHAKPTL